MPIYEYECQSCGARHEALQKLSDAPLLECPACHEPSLKKLVSAAAFKLTGTGWYETDFKNSGKPAEKQKNNEGGAASSGSGKPGNVTKSKDEKSGAAKADNAASSKGAKSQAD